MHTSYKICSRCIMDTSDPLIEFDEQGICNHCRSYEKRVENEVFSGKVGRQLLEQIVERIRKSGQGKAYDCIIGLSGGVDSTTIAYRVKRELGLRPLAVHFDNGWNSELAVDNIKNIVDKLDIDLYTHVVDWEEFRDLQLAFLKGSVINSEIPTDHGINALLLQTAAKHNIQYVIGGGNVVTEGILPKSWVYSNMDLKNLRAIHKRFGTKPLKTFPQLSLSELIYYMFIKGIRMIPLLNYLDYNKTEAMELIQRELGWRCYGGKHYESIYTRFYQGYILPKKYKVDKRRAHLSTLICSKQISRDKALAEITKDPYQDNNFREDLEFVLKKFGLSEEEFNQLMQAPIKSHFDYPSHKLYFDRLSKVRQYFRRILTTT